MVNSDPFKHYQELHAYATLPEHFNKESGIRDGVSHTTPGPGGGVSMQVQSQF